MLKTGSRGKKCPGYGETESRMNFPQRISRIRNQRLQNIALIYADRIFKEPAGTFVVMEEGKKLIKCISSI